ncbi:secretion system protein E [Candidatus Bathyarchaeota archaeon]|nr:MAG: secretion system protein E [Candidatus Bathyarchaeota archaeon]
MFHEWFHNNSSPRSLEGRSMKLSVQKRRKKEPSEKKEKFGISEETLAGYLDLRRWTVPEGYEEVETYPLKAPFSYASIVRSEDTGTYLYIVDELLLSREETDLFLRLRNILDYELQAPMEGETLKESFHAQMPEILDSHEKVFRDVPSIGLRKILYYLERDIVDYGKIDPLMSDPYVEDISCSGVDKHIFLWHRYYENIKTNILFQEEQKLDDFIMKIVHKAGKHVSIAFPIVDVSLPGQHRLAVSYGKETTPSGTSFTIRKFREDPFTIVDLIENETIDENIAAYLWLLMENKMSIMIMGATGAGKTTALNAIACLVRPNYKIISIEEVAEINLPHENWTATISRSGFGVASEGEITLYDLIKSAVRHRPDLIIVGEVRGEEAYVLFQALATGHGGLCTTHAEDVETAINRLTQPPMNIPSSIIPLMNCAIIVKHVRAPIFLGGNKTLSSRKFIRVAEIEAASSIRNVFTWNASIDAFEEKLKDSYLIAKIAKNMDVSVERIFDDLERRKETLLNMAEHNIRDYRSVNTVLSKHYYNPKDSRNPK